MISYEASYYKTSVFTENFKTLEEMSEYNTANNIKNNNLHELCLLDDIISNDGHIVCIEGDRDLEDRELSNALKEYKNFKMYNYIYKEPKKLLALKDLSIDALIIQSTGIRKKEIDNLQKWYIESVGTFPKNIICILGDEDDFLYDLIKASPFKIKIYKHRSVAEDGKVKIERWLGSGYKKESDSV